MTMRRYSCTLLLALWLLGTGGATWAQAPTPSLEATEAALKRGVGYFTARGLKIKLPDVCMLMDILGRHFDYPFNGHSPEAYQAVHPGLKESYFKCYKTAFADRHHLPYSPEEVAQYFEKNYPGLDARTLWSMYCADYPLAEDYVAVLQQLQATDSYELTHAALQYQNARLNGCLSGTTPAEQTLEQDLLKGLQAIAQEAPYNTPDIDIRLEALVMLFYMNRPELVDPALIQWVLDAQLPDGGWGEFSGQEKGGDHASVLAMWVLLEYRSRLL